jgi:hypothetical protein
MVQQLQDMQSRLLGVAKDLEVAIEDPAPTPEEPVAKSEPATSEPAVKSEVTGGDDPVDSLEGMLSDEDVDLPEIPSLELDFDDDDQA